MEIKKIGCKPPENSSEVVEITGFLPRNPQLKEGKDGSTFKSFTLGVYMTNEEDAEPVWFSMTAPSDFDHKKGDVVTLKAKIWKRFYKSKSGERKMEYRGTLNFKE